MPLHRKVPTTPSKLTEATLFNPDPTAYIPHRPPFLFIDSIVELEPGIVATGDYEVTAEGYFPPILLVEAMAQIGGIAAGQQEGQGGLLAALNRVELPQAVMRKTNITVCSRIVKSFGGLIQVNGEARQDGEVIATATLTLAIGPTTQFYPRRDSAPVIPVCLEGDEGVGEPMGSA